MRNLKPRPELDSQTRVSLSLAANAIRQLDDIESKKKTAKEAYDSARTSKWFEPVIENLRKNCDGIERCMYCSLSAPVQVEHYRPLSVFPDLAFVYENYLWSCGECNQKKANRFPPDTQVGAQILNPIDDNIWDHFELHPELGHLLKRQSPETEEDFPRAVSTCEIVGIDRVLVQDSRRKWFKRMKRTLVKAIGDLQADRTTVLELREEISELRNDPFQADVADYFLNGPGRVYEPFKSALSAIGEEISK